MKITESVLIHSTLENVFNEFTNLDHAKNNLSGIKKLELLSGSAQMEVGTKWRETREMMGKDSTEEMWVTELIKNKSYKVAAESHGTKYLSTFLFEELDDQIKVSWTFDGQPQTFMAKAMGLLAFLFMGSLKKMLIKDLEDLKQACES